MKTTHWFLAGLAYMLGAWFWPQFIVFRPGSWILGMLGFVKQAPGQSSGTTDFYALGKKPVKAADDITLGTPNSQGTTDGGKTWGNAAIGETMTS